MKVNSCITLIFGLLLLFCIQSKSEEKRERDNSAKLLKQRVAAIKMSAAGTDKFKNRSQVLGSAGSISSSSSYKTVVSIGQPSPIGIDQNLDYINRSGFVSTIKSTYKIAGNAVYALNEKPVCKVSIFLCGDIAATALSNDLGYYEFIDLEQGQPYQIVPQKYADFIEDSTINLTDARRVHLYLAGSIEFNQYEWLASDVDENGVVDYGDETLIIKRALLNGSADTVKNHCGQWRFIPNKYCYPALIADTSNQNFKCIILGDNDGSWKSSSISKAINEPITCSGLQDLFAYPDSLLDFPISLDQRYEVFDAEIRLEYDTKRLKFVSCRKTEQTIAFNLVAEIDSINGIIACALISTNKELIQGNLLRFQFNILGEKGDIAEPSLVRLSVNDRLLFCGKAQVSIVSPKAIPDCYQLHQNYPNPCNSTTAIAYDLAERKSNKTLLKIYNLKGQLVKTLIDSEQNAGFYRAVWDVTDEFGTPVASGIYIYKLTSGSFQKTRKLIIVK